MEEEIKRALEGAIESGYLNLAHAIIKVVIKDTKQSARTCHLPNVAYTIADRVEPRGEIQAFFSSEGFLWLLQLIGCEPRDLEDIAGRIMMKALGP